MSEIKKPIIFIALISLTVLNTFITPLPLEDINTALIEALEKNDEEGVDALLAQRANPNHIATDDKTALQISIKQHAIHNTAQLLRYGANGPAFKSLAPTINPAVLHLIRETYQRLPDPFYQKKHPTLHESEVYLAELKQHGFVKISGLLSAQQIEQLKKDFKMFLDDVNQHCQQKKVEAEKPFAELYKQERENIFVSNNPFKYSAELIRTCCHPAIIETINCYLGKVGFIHKGSATHYLPGGARGTGVFNWHHDAAGKRVKLMILMSDTDEDSRCTTYIEGSHTIIHPLSEYTKNMLDPSYCLKFIPEVNIVKFTGKPGDMYLFDTNGIHSGNIAPKGRDAFIISYSSDMGHVRPYKIDENVFKTCHLIDRNPFDLMLKIQNDPSFKVPKAAGWVGHLSNPDAWLMDRNM